MTINDIIVLVVAIFFLVGIIDKALLGGRLRLAEAVDSGVAQIPGLLFLLAGVMCLIPLIVKFVTPVITPVYELLGADPAAFSGILIGPDAGGFSMASAMTDNEEIMALSGLYLASMLGVTLVFSLPWSMSVVNEEDKDVLIKGMLCGMIAAPFGTMLAGVVAGYSFSMILLNLLPAIIIILVVAVGLLKAQKLVVKIFAVYSKLVIALAALAVGCAGFELLTGIKLIPGLDGIEDKFAVIGNIGLSMGGALALVYVLQKILKKPFQALGRMLKINDVAVLGIFASIANAMPVFSDMVKDMDPRGKLLCIAFAGPAWCALGSHLAYTSTVMPEALLPQVIGKLAAGVLAMGIALLFFGKSYAPQKTEDTE